MSSFYLFESARSANSINMLKQFQNPNRVKINAPNWLRNLNVCFLLGAAIVAAHKPSNDTTGTGVTSCQNTYTCRSKSMCFLLYRRYRWFKLKCSYFERNFKSSPKTSSYWLTRPFWRDGLVRRSGREDKRRHLEERVDYYKHLRSQDENDVKRSVLI